MTDKTSIGDRMKSYEQPTIARRAFKGQPIIARLDGKSFHTWTRGLKKPFDKNLGQLMSEVTKYVVDSSGANFGYTQSDEITLGWFVDSTSQAEYVYGGRLQKLESLLAAQASVVFNANAPTYIDGTYDRGLAIFDCRAFVVPNLLEAYHAVLWRQQDCTKNAINSAAQALFSHKSLQGLNGAQLQEKMFAEAGVNFNDYPAWARRGTLVRRVKVFKPMDDETRRRLSVKGIMMPTAPIERSELQISTPWLSRLEDPVAFLFKGAPETYRTATGTLEEEV